ncbi:endosomal peripheral membrane protein [Pseudomassariella vexata]|uniref:Endosomal peripheral membrane protein n=1 Tax=Pseudomassariella vexata TaxID=1141098 RepID=A0A1Y2DRE5_9PEZI|nr:endosomal peripheral membrane protein [Pseudomassariella vexata]ORY61759.1 endosomal peripheral membrane protein [Pseudomassariella vexata]
MTTQLLTSELTNLIQESKRKHNDLRQAAEKSLEELKSIRGANEAQIAAELAQRVNFVNPFVVACGTKNAKFTGIAIVCLQRLVMASALPRSKLSPVLEALREATTSGLDVQLKILQALPTLLQNYSADIKGDLLVTALNICFVLQTSKNGIVNNTSAATLQQLVVSVFDKVVAEDRLSSKTGYVGDAPTQDGHVQLHSAALDAHRVFNDICLMTENQRPEYLRFTGLPQTFGLELIESVLTNHASIFSSHPEQAHVLRTRVMPFLTSALSGKTNFATTVRLVRILYTLLRRHLTILPNEGGEALEILTKLLDQDTAIWRRALCMEVFRGIFADPGLLRKIFLLYDNKDEDRDILKGLMGTFVRVSTEKPAVIGLGHQSTIPIANPYANLGTSTDQAMLEASGVTGIISGSVGEGYNTGISSQWSTIRVPCIDQLDKTDPPPIPESYIYALTLSCITSLSEGLAKFILPLTVPTDRGSRKRGTKLSDTGRESPAPIPEDGTEPSKATLERTASSDLLTRSGSFKRNPVPVNPLVLKDHPLYQEVRICAQIVDECWPAILATCSTFLFAALDSEYYHGLVRAFQKFAHVAGLLQLNTPRDAFLTTLGKAAVPPNVFTACLNAGSSKGAPATPTVEAPSSLLGNARGLLSVDNLVTPVGAAGERQRQASADASVVSQTLNTRNLLCLRALLNLGIALGPTLSSSWSIILETLQQADFVLFSTGKVAGKTPMANKGSDQKADSEANSLLANFSTEIRAVETAASRLFESTVDFPNESFVEVVSAVCSLLGRHTEPACEPASQPQSPASQSLTPPTPQGLRTSSGQHRKMLSVSTVSTTGLNQEDQFALAKLGDVAIINIERLLTYPPEVSGWTPLVSELIWTLSGASMSAQVRTRAADILVRLVLDAANTASSFSDELRGKVQLRLLEAFRNALLPLQMSNRQSSVASYSTDVDIHKVILEGLKSMLDNCGETLISGWDIAFEIINSIFLEKRFADDGSKTAESQSTRLMTRSGRLIRSSFNSLQLICSDFLSSLPNSCFLILVDTLYKFCSQDDDLNIALTTVTFFWVLSDFLSGKNKHKSLPITDGLVGGTDDSDLVEKAADPQNASSDAALWMLLLLRLTTVTTDDRLELRNSATHTLLRIFDAYGDRLSPEGWSVCIKSVIFRLMTSIEDKLQSVSGREVNEKERNEWHDTAVVVLNGISGLLANYLDVLTVHPTFNSYWQQLLGHFATLLDFQVLEINTATFKSLGQILSQSQNGAKQNFNKTTIDLAWDLWSRGIPIAKNADGAKVADNQNCLLAYVAALRDVYRLIQADLTVDRISRMLTLMTQAMQQATPGAFFVDIDYTTPLQSKILDVLKMLRTDLPGAPSALISEASQFISLAFENDTMSSQRSTQKRTYVAMSKASMLILEALVVAHASDPGIYSDGAFLAALSALSKPIVLKYQFPTLTKTTQPWKVATTSALSILEATLHHLRNLDISRSTVQDIWQTIVSIANGITNADCNVPPERINLVLDQNFDIASFTKLRELIIPSLGADLVPEKTRKLFAESLFRMSIIHAPAPAESDLIYGNNAEGLTSLYKPRPGRTVDPTPTLREKMAYVCLEELFALVSTHDEAAAPSITIQPPTPGFPSLGTPSSTNAPSEPPHQLHVRLARTVAPYLILRAALTLRSYIADQPLRGRMPQPLSQRKELSRILNSLVTLQSESEAIPDMANVESETRKHLLRLYPLIVDAVKVAGRSGDEDVGNSLGKALEVVGGELGV